jgi:imidazole glycerol-phosphate synthase subunit HisH
LTRIAIIDYGAGNLRSVARAMQKIGAEFFVTDKPEEVAASSAIILPGVGAFRDCVDTLRERDLDVAIKSAINEGRPFLGICLGLQVLFESSEEFGSTQGFGILPGRVTRFSGGDFEGSPPKLKIPHMGWTRIREVGNHPIFDGVPNGSYFYFVHSFFVHPENPPDIIALAEHGGAFTAAAARGNVIGVQFHPEKSQEAGLCVLKNFIRIAQGELACS